MKLGLLTSNQIRHKFLANALDKNHDLSIIISEKKGNQNQLIGKNDFENKILTEHFKSLENEQKIFFGGQEWPRKADIIKIDRGYINSKVVEDSLKESKVDGIAVFGPGILKENIFSICPGNVINAHQGFSPYYRGSATNFWPFVNGQLKYIGLTMHYIDKGIDTGGIICHAFPKIEQGDSMHRIGCKVIEKTAEMFEKIFTMIEKGYRPNGIRQWSKGKLYLRKDFNAQAGLRAKENILNGLIDEYVNQKEIDTLTLQTIHLI